MNTAGPSAIQQAMTRNPHCLDRSRSRAGRPSTGSCVPRLPFGRHDVSLDTLRSALLEAALERNGTPSLIPWIRSAAHEAAAIAWLHPFPLLVFPTLFEEKLTAAHKHHHQQNLIRSRTEEWLTLAF